MDQHKCSNVQDHYAATMSLEDTTLRDGSSMYQTDCGQHRLELPDGRVLTVWTDRLLLCPELREQVDERFGVSDLPFPEVEPPSFRHLAAPVFNSQLEAPGMGIVDAMDSSSTDGLADHLLRCEGIIVPQAMLDDLDADATLARFGDLHVDHLGTVFRMEALTRDNSTLERIDPVLRTAAQRDQLAMIAGYRTAMVDDLERRRLDDLFRGGPNRIGTLPAQWTRDARERELRAWPGGEQTQQVLEELSQSRGTWYPGIGDEQPVDRARVDALSDGLSKNMSHARLRDWDATAPTNISQADLRDWNNEAAQSVRPDHAAAQMDWHTTPAGDAAIVPPVEMDWHTTTAATELSSVQADTTLDLQRDRKTRYLNYLTFLSSNVVDQAIVKRALLDGRSQSETAELLGMTEQTVNNHSRQAFYEPYATLGHSYFHDAVTDSDGNVTSDMSAAAQTMFLHVWGSSDAASDALETCRRYDRERLGVETIRQGPADDAAIVPSPTPPWLATTAGDAAIAPPVEMDWRTAAARGDYDPHELREGDEPAPLIGDDDVSDLMDWPWHTPPSRHNYDPHDLREGDEPAPLIGDDDVSDLVDHHARPQRSADPVDRGIRREPKKAPVLNMNDTQAALRHQKTRHDPVPPPPQHRPTM